MDIQIQKIQFSYNGTPAIDDINAKINPGDLLALVGPNGSGKSTLIKCINGVLKAQKGVVLVNKTDISDYRTGKLAREMAYVPQRGENNTSSSVFDVILLGRKPYINWKPTSADLEVVAGVIDTLHLNALAMKDFDKLSGGQQQIVHIARALAQQPNVLLLDEPTANLDIKHQIEVMEVLKKLSGEKITIIIALHDINMAARYASHIMMLKKGRVFSYGSNETISEENIRNLYDIDVKIIRDGETVFVIPAS